MTCGRVIVLGLTGRNLAAGMSGGMAYVLDMARDFKSKVNQEIVELVTVNNPHKIAGLRKIRFMHLDYKSVLEAGSKAAIQSDPHKRNERLEVQLPGPPEFSTSTKCPIGSLEFGNHSRPVSTISVSATTSFSSTLTPPPGLLAVHVHDYRVGQLAPEGTKKHDRKLEEAFLPSVASLASSLLKKYYYYSGDLGMGVDLDQLIFPLERLSSLGPARPTIKARNRSGIVPPSKTRPGSPPSAQQFLLGFALQLSAW
ncbi:glutamate synthase [Puccinia sorghi]|uniref:Glutamate synthase n=1 Tax=Puccinia sorghi TaxID=27349 RepID=A0A0L6UZH0_9BASI|nr:glutamate synthase [Puccinia sorghi]KNZ53647.1 glutamate synthase [Puccinia sorghi]